MNAQECPRCGQTGGTRTDSYHDVCYVADERDAARAAYMHLRNKIMESLGPLAYEAGHGRVERQAALKAIISTLTVALETAATAPGLSE